MTHRGWYAVKQNSKSNMGSFLNKKKNKKKHESNLFEFLLWFGLSLMAC